MPRDGSGTYTYPPGTRGAPATPIESLKYNNYIDDVAIDLNTPRPVSAGGTGGTTVNDTLDNLSAEKFKQVVTNWDTTVWRAGSFYAASTAVGTAPVTGHAFAGICYFANATDFVCEATDLADPANPDKYIRVMAAGVWGQWVRLNASTSSANLGEYTFSNQVTFPPASGEIRFNNATQNSTTEVFISHLSPMGVDNSSQITAIVKSGIDLLVQDKDEGSKYKIYTATADAVLSGGDFRTTVTFKSGGLDIVSAQRMLVAASGETQRVAQRQLIYAAPLDALAYSGMQINGSMDVSQEYAPGLSPGWLNYVSVGGLTYAIDGWQTLLKQATAGTTAFSVGQVGSSLTGIINSLQVLATGAATFAGATDMAVLLHTIEGYRWARLGFGNSDAQSVTVGFWVFASVTGKACVLIGSNGTQKRCYIQEYTINAANTWEYKTLTFPPDVTTPANWLKTNGSGAYVAFCFGGGATTKGGTAGVWANWGAQYATSNQINFFANTSNTVYITGVVVLPGIEAPSAARSPLIMRPYDQELLTCMRYWQTFVGNLSGFNGPIAQTYTYSVPMRAAPTLGVTVTGTLTNVLATIQDSQTTTNIRIGASPATAAAMGFSGRVYTLDARL